MTTYPLMDDDPEPIHAASGRLLSDVTFDDDLSLEDLTINADTLRIQAAIAREAGYPQLAANLIRASELTGVPNSIILRIYTLLRPKRASYDELMELASMLEDKYGAVANANFIRDAADIYRTRGLLRPV
jgi:propanediol dehydratase small subunit